MTTYSKILSLISGLPKTIDFSNTSNVLGLANLQLLGSTSGYIQHEANATTTSYTLVWPATQASMSGYVLTNDGSGNLSWAAAATSLTFADSLVNTGGTVTLVNDTASPGANQYYGTNGSSVLGYYTIPTTGANTALSNLASVAINTSLLPGIDDSISLGSSSFSWAGGFVHFLKDASNVSAIAVYSRVLDDTSGGASVDWGNRDLKDSSGAIQLAWSTSGVEFNQLTASTVPYLNSGNVLTSSTVTPTQLGYLSGASGTTGTGSLVFSAAPAITGAWTLTDAGEIVNATTTTKALAFNLSGMTAAKTLTLSSSQSTTQTLTIPNITASDTLATLGLPQTFSAAITLSASGTALSVTNSASIGTLSLTNALSATNGGTSQSTYTTGDTLYASATNTLSKLGIGSTGQVLTVAGGVPTWATPATSGTVTSVSVVSTNGFAGTVATATTTPAITIETTINSPILAGNGTAISAATTTGTGSTAVLSAGPAITGAWSLTDAGEIVNATTTTKALAFNLSGMTAAKTLTLSSSQSTTQTLTIPNITASDTLATLGLAQTFSGDITLSASGTALTVTNTASIGTLNLSNALGVTYGGTGTTTAPTQYGVIYASSTSAYASTSAGTANYPLVANSGAAPTFQQLSLTAGVTGTLPIANGGTNATTSAAGTILNASSGTAASFTATPTLGVAGSTAGTIALASSTASTGLVTLANGGTTSANAYTFSFPTTGGTNGYALTTNGSGTTSWTSIVTNPMTTGGDLIIGGSSGTPTRLANGTSGQVLMSNGGTSAETWATVPGNTTILTAPNFQSLTFDSTTFTGKVTSGSPTVTNVSSFTGLYVGMGLSASADVTAGTYIIAINTGGSTLTLSANATGGSATTVTFTPYNSGSGFVTGTYVTPTNPSPLYLRVRLVGGGGGGGSNESTGGTGGTGGNTTFGTSLLIADGGVGGGPGSDAGGAGGSASVSSPASGSSFTGGTGQGSSGNSVATGAAGGNGAASPFGGAGGGGQVGNNAGFSAASNTGSGGGGAGANATAQQSGAGGGAGGYVDAIISGSLSSTYAFQVGGGGAAGTGGLANGGAGGSGIIIVEAHYQ
jgi:hypothetical protein